METGMPQARGMADRCVIQLSIKVVIDSFSGVVLLTFDAGLVNAARLLLGALGRVHALAHVAATEVLTFVTRRTRRRSALARL